MDVLQDGREAGKLPAKEKDRSFGLASLWGKKGRGLTVKTASGGG